MGSIDARGLEGLNSVRAFDRHLLLASPAIVEPRDGAFLGGEYAIFRWMQVEGSSRYHFQLARDPQFTDMPIERMDISSNQLQVGLGLAFVRVVAQKHGGTIEVRSDAGHSATFSLVIPQIFGAGDGNRTHGSSLGS